MKQYVLFLFVIAWHIASAQVLGDFRVKLYSIEDGLSQSSIINIFQDSNGYMWFATENGLNRYDGYEFRAIQYLPGDTTSLSDSRAICMAEDEHGMLWVGAKRGLNAVEPNSLRVKQYVSKNPCSVNEIKIDKQGMLWAATDNGLRMINTHTGRDTIFHFPGEWNSLNDLDIQADSMLWLAGQSGMVQFNKSTFSFRLHDLQTTIRHLLVASDSLILLATFPG